MIFAPGERVALPGRWRGCSRRRYQDGGFLMSTGRDEDSGVLRTAEVARILHEALQADDPEAFIEAYEHDGRIAIDGHFNLKNVIFLMMKALLFAPNLSCDRHYPFSPSE